MEFSTFVPQNQGTTEEQSQPRQQTQTEDGTTTGSSNDPNSQQFQQQEQQDINAHGLQGQQGQQQQVQQQPNQLFGNVNMNNLANFTQGFQLMQQPGNMAAVPFALMGPSQQQLQQLSALSGFTGQLPQATVFPTMQPNAFQGLQHGFQGLPQVTYQQPLQQPQQQPQQQQPQNIFNAQFLQQMGMAHQQQQPQQQQQPPQVAMATPPIMNFQQLQQLMAQQILNQGQVTPVGVPVMPANVSMVPQPQFASLAGAFATQQVQQQQANPGAQQLYSPVNGVNVANLTLPGMVGLPGGELGVGAKAAQELEWAEPFAGKGKKEPPFPLKLHQILGNPEFSECISWNSHGRSWR
jgi:hypothetical protein